MLLPVLLLVIRSPHASRVFFWHRHGHTDSQVYIYIYCAFIFRYVTSRCVWIFDRVWCLQTSTLLIKRERASLRRSTVTPSLLARSLASSCCFRADTRASSMRSTSWYTSRFPDVASCNRWRSCSTTVAVVVVTPSELFITD